MPRPLEEQTVVVTGASSGFGRGASSLFGHRGANVVLAEPITIKDGHAYIPERPGNGMTWDESAVARYQFE